MKKPNSRNELNDILFDHFTVNNEFIKKSEAIALELKTKVYPNRIAEVFNGQIDLDMLQDYEIYFLAKALFIKFKGGKIIDPSNFFTVLDMEKYEGMPDIDYSKERNNQIIFNDCYQVTPTMWSCSVVPITYIASLQNDSLTIYNKDTQRETEKRHTPSGVKERIKTYSKSIAEIKSAMKSHTYFPTAISYNVLANGYEKIDYDAEKKRLIIEINENNECNIVDGYHRVKSCIEALRDDPDLKQNMQVNIFHLDVATARMYILQESKKNEIAKELLSYFNTDNIASKLINDLDNEGTSTSNFIRGHLSPDFETVNLRYKYCTYATLIKAVENNFKLDKDDVISTRKVKEYLIDFLNEVISIYKDEFKDVKKSRETSFKTYNNIFYGYIAMAAKLFGQSKWQDKLKAGLDEIDFDRENKQWQGMGLTSKNISGKQINVLYKLFKNHIKIEEVAKDGE